LEAGDRGAGDAEATLARAMTMHAAVLQRAAERILGCPDLARDAVQETLIALWRHNPDLRAERAWLIQTVIHRSLALRRSHRRRLHWEREADGHIVDGCPLCVLSGDLERAELVHLLEAALQSLPESLRVVFLLRELEGYPYDRIARRLGMPLGTVRSRLNRARRVVRAWISEAQARARAEIAPASLACSTPRGRTANLRVETVTCAGPVRRTSCSVSRARARETR
jgi:RNA polymerase sigma-70 factor, ECF subfamily